MRYLDQAERDAILARVVSARTFVTFWAKTRDTGAPVVANFWSDGGAFDAQVVDALTGATQTRTFAGGALVEVGNIPLISGIRVRTVDLVFSGVSADIDALLRTYDLRGAPVQIYRGYFSPETHHLVAPAKARFVGFVDEAPITNGKEGEAAKVTVTVVSHTRELTRKNQAVRSHEDQQRRAPGDDFYKDTGVVGEWDLAWGEERKKAGDGAMDPMTAVGVIFGKST